MSENDLSIHYSFKKLLKLVTPTVIMMAFTSIYGVVDGLFISNFAGSTAFAAVNIIIPVIMAYSAVGFMLGTGGSALIAKTMGEGNFKKANEYFYMLTALTVFFGLALTAVGEATLIPVCRLLKATGETLDDCILYGAISLGGLTPFMLQNAFQSFFTAAGKHKLGLAVIVAAGLTNAALDAIFIAGFKWGVAGAAAATVCGQVVGGIIPLIYFSCKNSSYLRLRPVKLEFKPILKAMANGSSEMLSQLSMSFVNIVYNFQLLKYLGENGVSAYGFMMYVSFIFASIFLGYSVGVAPVISYNYGAGNKQELRSVFKKSLIIISVFSVLMFALALALNHPLSLLFVGYDKALLELSEKGFFIMTFTFLFFGFNIFGSALFTALNNGLISALISGLRTLVFQIASVMLLPLAFAADGIWYSMITADLLALLVTVIFILANYKKYFKERPQNA